MALTWLYLFPYNARLNNPNERTRVLQARAMLEHGRLSVGDVFRTHGGSLRFRDIYGTVHAHAFVNDVGLVCNSATRHPPNCEGKLYPAKAPGTALLGLPVLALARAVGFYHAGRAGELRATWVLRYGGVALPLLLALLAFAWLLLRANVPEPLVARAVVATGLGTGLLPYGIMFVGHAMAGGALLGGIFWLVKATSSPRRHFVMAFAGGLTTAFAVLFEYHAALGVACVTVWVLASRERRSLLPGFIAGATLPLVIHVTTHVAMFHSPVKTAHFFLLSAHNRASQSGGFLGLGGLHWGALRDTLFDPYMGLLPLMPWLVVGSAAGLPWMLRGSSRGTLPAGSLRAMAAIPLLYLLFTSSLGQWRMMNGWSIGPRYLVPATLPLALAATLGWDRLARVNHVASRLFAGLAGAAIVMIVAVTTVFPQPPPGAENPFSELAIPLLTQGYAVRNLGLHLGLGRACLIPLAVLATAGIGWVMFGSDGRRMESAFTKNVRFRRIWALLAGSVWVASMAAWRPSPPAARQRAQAFVRKTGEGLKPSQIHHLGASLQN